MATKYVMGRSGGFMRTIAKNNKSIKRRARAAINRAARLNNGRN